MRRKKKEGAQIIPFPRPPLPIEHGVLAYGDNYPDGTIIVRCSDSFHIFKEREGLCQCGERTWVDDAV